MSAVETTSIMSDVGLDIYQLRIIIRILRNKLGAKMFEPENIIKSLSGDMILPKFGEYKYYHEEGNESEYILLWVCDTVDIFKKETQLLLESGVIDVYNINRMDIVVGGDYGQEAFRFPIRILCIMNNGNRHESIQSVGYILCKENHGIFFEEYNN